MGRNRVTSVFTALVATLMLAFGAIGAAGATTAHTAAPKIHNGGHLTEVNVQASGTWVGMDPFLPNIPPATAAMFPVWDPLFNLNPVTNAIEYTGLATNSKVSGGGLVITITLRRGVKFQDGTAFTASSVVWNLERYMNPAVNSECTAYLTVVSSVVATSAYTVTINLNSRDAGIIPLLATQQCALMVSPTAYQSEGSNFTNDPVGTGPYKFLSGTPGSVSNFVPWTGYWGGKPHFSEVTLEAVTSDANALSALQSGSAQAWLSFVDIGAVTQIEQARADRSLVVQHTPASSITYVTFSFTHSPFDNQLYREAVTYATNPAVIDKQLYQNVYKPVQGIVPPSDFAFTNGVERAYPGYNPTKAEAIVKQLGGSLNFQFLVSNTPTQIQLADALAAQWQPLGINAQITPVTTGTLITNLHALSYQALLINSPGLPDPDNIFFRWFYSKSVLTQNGLKSSVADKLIIEGRSDYGRPARVKAYTTLNNYISGLDPWDDVAATSAYSITAKNLVGATADQYDMFPWQSMYFS